MTAWWSKCSTSGACRLLERWRRPSSETFCLMMTAPSTPAHSRRQSAKWAASQKPVITWVLSSAPRLRWCTSQRLKSPQEPHTTVKGQILQAVDSFTYLGSTLSRAVNIDAEVSNRIAKPSSAFGRLRENVWKRRELSLTTKLKVYRAVVLTTLLYACKIWTVYRRHAKPLNHVHLSCLRRLLQIKWQYPIQDAKASIPTVHTLL